VADIFISYSSHDRRLAKTLAAWLEAQGFSVWWDYNLVGGQDYREEIVGQLKSARAVIVIWTEKSASSKWVLDEADEAGREGKLVPLRAPGFHAEKAPFGYRQLQTYSIDETERILAALSRLGLPLSDRTPPKPAPLRWRRAIVVVSAASITAVAVLLALRPDPFPPPPACKNKPQSPADEAPIRQAITLALQKDDTKEAMAALGRLTSCEALKEECNHLLDNRRKFGKPDEISVVAEHCRAIEALN
jgi:hypothetical protein